MTGLPPAAIAPLAAGILFGILVAACGGGASRSPQAEALAYMETHPVPAAAGMTAGVILAGDVKGFAGAAAAEAGCPATLLSHSSRAAGSPPGCGAWVLTVETAAGHAVTVSCGSITARRPCPMLLTGNEGTYVPGAGDYILFRSGGQVTTAAGIRLVTYDAVDAIAAQAPDDTSPFVTSPAGGRN